MKPDAFDRRREVLFDTTVCKTVEKLAARLAEGEYRIKAVGDESHPNVVKKVLSHFRERGWGLPPEDKGDLDGDPSYVKYWENLNDEGGFYVFMTPQIRSDKAYETDRNQRQRDWLKRKDEAERRSGSIFGTS